MTQEFPIWTQNNAFSARLDRQLVKALFTEGVVSGLAVTAGTGMQVTVDVGSAVIYGDDQTNQGAYLAITTVAENLAIGAAPGAGLSRIDRIIYRINDPNAGGPAGNNSTLAVVAGTAAASPVAPAIPTSAISLATVTVANGTVAITNAMITNTRSPALLAGQTPPGTIVAFMGPESAIPSTWSICNGGTLSRSTEFALFSVIGTTYGSGDGSTTFNKPDMRGRVPVGLDNMGGSDAGVLSTANTLGLAIGAETTTLTTNELPAHTHSTPSHVHTGSMDAQGSHAHNISHGHTVTVDATGGHTHAPGAASQFAVLGNSTVTVEPQNDGDKNGWFHTASSDAAAATTATASSGGHAHGGTVSNLTASSDTLGSHSHTITMNNGGNGTSGSAGSGVAFSQMQPSRMVNWIIKL